MSARAAGGRHAREYLGRPRHFETHEAALYFAGQRASRNRRRQDVRLETGLRGLKVWAVRQTHELVRRPIVIELRPGMAVLTPPSRSQRASLDRMELEA